MNSNTSSQSDPRASAGEAPAGLPAGAPAGPGGLPAGLEALAAAVAELAAGDPTQLGDALLAEQVVVLRRLTDQLDAVWLRRLAAVDARGAAGAEHGTQARSTTAWLRATCQMSPGAAAQRVRTARALHRGPLAGTAGALAAGEVSYAHAATLADATGDLPPTKVAEAEEVLVEAARRLDPSRLRRLTTHLRDVIDPEKAEQRAGALGELARQALQAGRLPQEGGLRPQLTVTIELASLLTEPGGLGGTGGWGGTLPPETTRRLACDATITRAIIHRHPTRPDPGHPSHGKHPTSGGGATRGARG